MKPKLFATLRIEMRDNEPQVECKIAGVKITAIIGTGAKMNVISEEDVQKIKKYAWAIIENSVTDAELKIYGIDKNPLKNICKFTATIEIPGGTESPRETFLVIKQASTSLIGFDTSYRMNLIMIPNMTIAYAEEEAIPRIVMESEIPAGSEFPVLPGEPLHV